MAAAADTLDPVASATPQVRTLLLTDLVDSTTLVERLGDSAAAELFREHDHLVLQLQQRWRGRLIDRSDGLLLLFERPIDGLGFALDYARGLRALGEARRLPLQARAGLHVGELLTWRNSTAAVQAGAKALEVEGLAKPFTGRLMALARPGQILVSATAEPLARRAARELGERGEQLLWKSHGRWRFKGVPQPQEIVEVGEPGFTPLQAPRHGAKAWRDIPLWRRPAALAAELLLLVGMGTGLWFITRPQPAIAFGERDWVVVADLRNLTGQGVLDDSLQQAFRISLEQSRYVNVLSDLKARDTLARMQRAPGTPLDRVIASEIALRDGARAVILPTVAEVGGRVRVSAEVIDPHTQTTVYAESADGVGVGSTLESIDDVTAALRGRLGEALAAIDKDSAPLPQVTTRNLDALRAYALGQKAYGKSDMPEALRFYERASRLDPDFALAWIGQVRTRFSIVEAPAALPALRRAQTLRHRLAPREAMYLDAWVAEFDAPAKALSQWTELAALYPDFWAANGNVANGLVSRNRFAEAAPFIQRNLAPQNELASLGYDLLGRAELGTERYGPAARAFDQALGRGLDSSLRRRAAVEASQRNFAAATRLLRKTRPDDPYPYLDKISSAIDQGHWPAAGTHAKTVLDLVAGSGGFTARFFLMPAAVATWLAGDRDGALHGARNAASQALTALDQPYDADAAEDGALALSAALFAQRLGDRSLARQVLDAVESKAVLMAVPTVAELAAVAKAGEARLKGDPEAAIGLLRPWLTGHERYETRVALQEAYADAGRTDEALQQSDWLQRHRGLAYVQLGCAQCLQALNVADSNLAVLRAAELLHVAGKPVEARRRLARFDGLWPAQTLPGYLRVRRSAVMAASN